GTRYRDLGWVEPGLVNLPVAHYPDGGRPRGGQLVEPVVTVEDEGRAASAGQHARKHRTHPRVSDADSQSLRPGRIRDRTEEVEHGRYSELAPRAGRVPQRRVVQRRAQDD